MGNGVGPWWWPAWLRVGFTWFSSLFFEEASWDHHDEGYQHGSPPRATCDRKFMHAMLRDASQADTTARTLACVVLALIYWLSVRAFGWASYNYKGSRR